MSHCVDPSDGGSRSHLAENTRNLCYQHQPVVVVVVVVVEGVNAVGENYSKYVK